MILTGVQSLPSRLQCEYQTFQRQQNEILLQAVKHKCKVFLKQNTSCKKIATMLNVHVIDCIHTGMFLFIVIYSHQSFVKVFLCIFLLYIYLQYKGVYT